MESWEDIFEGSDKNTTFNNFLNILKSLMLAFRKANIIPPVDITH